MGDIPSDPLAGLLSATVKEACRLSGFSKDAIYDVLHTGEVRSFLMGARRYIEIASLRAYIARRAAEPLRSGRAPIKRRMGRRMGEGLADPPRPPRRPTV